MVQSPPTIIWEKTVQCRPAHNIISSDFAKFIPPPWKFLVFQEGKSKMGYVLSYEYERMWREELKTVKKELYPKKSAYKNDVVKRYVLTFKNKPPRPKPKKNEPFKIKKFKAVRGKTSNHRPPNDKAMNYQKTK